MRTRGLVAAWLVLVVGACGPSTGVGPDAFVTDEACTNEGQTRCTGPQYQVCRGGFWTIQETCSGGKGCDPALECVDCRPGDIRACDGDAVVECNADGTFGDVVETCAFEQ